MTKRLYLAVLSLALPALAGAEVPLKLGYQGRILKSDGTPEGGVVSVTFSLYANPTGGAPLWSEQQSIALSDGFYSTILGDVTALSSSVVDGSERYIELTVGGSPMTPRQRVVSVPYAVAASNVAGGKVSASSIEVGGQPFADSEGKIDWTRIKNLPSGFADGTDDSGVVSVSVSAPIKGDGTSGNPIALGSASGSADGYLTSADWTKFDKKLASVSASAPLTGEGTSTAPLKIAAASTSVDGYLAAVDYARFDGKLGSVAVSAPLSGTGTALQPLTLAPASASAAGYLSASDFDAFSKKVASVSAGAGLKAGGTPTAPELAVDFGTASGKVAEGNHTHDIEASPGLNLLRNAALVDGDANNVPDFAIKDIDDSNYAFVTLDATEVHSMLGGSAASTVKMYAVDLRSMSINPTPTETMTFIPSLTPANSVDVTVTCSVYVRRRPNEGATNATAKMVCFDKSVTLDLPKTDSTWHRLTVTTKIAESASIPAKLIVYGAGTRTGSDIAFVRYALPKVEYGKAATEWNAHDPQAVAGDWQIKGGLNVAQGAVIGQGLKLGNDTATCSSAKAGTLRYNSGYIEYCDGAGWVGAMGRPIIYSGGCGSHGTGSGYNRLCLNQIDFNTAGGYLTINSDSITVNKAGYYRITFWTISLGSGYAHPYIYRNGNVLGGGVGHEYVHGQWSDNFVDITYSFQANDNVYLSIYNPGSYAYHSWPYNRVQMQYVGPL